MTSRLPGVECLGGRNPSLKEEPQQESQARNAQWVKAFPHVTAKETAEEAGKNLLDYTAEKGESTSDFQTVLQGAPWRSQQPFRWQGQVNLFSPPNQVSTLRSLKFSSMALSQVVITCGLFI